MFILPCSNFSQQMAASLEETSGWQQILIPPQSQIIRVGCQRTQNALAMRPSVFIKNLWLALLQAKYRAVELIHQDEIEVCCNQCFQCWISGMKPVTVIIEMQWWSRSGQMFVLCTLLNITDYHNISSSAPRNVWNRQCWGLVLLQQRRFKCGSWDRGRSQVSMQSSSGNCCTYLNF